MNRELIERDLKSFVKGDVKFDPLSRALFSTAACIFRIPPLGVVAPRDTEDVQHLLQYCAAHGIPVTPRGGGSSLAGQGVGHGIIIDLRKYMHNLLEVNPRERWARVQPGLIYGSLNQGILPHRLVFPPDPSSGAFCTVGGMIGTNAAGAHTLEYGATKDHLRSALMVTANGDLLTLSPAPLEKLPDLPEKERALYTAMVRILGGSSAPRDADADKEASEGQSLPGGQVPSSPHFPLRGVTKNSCGYNIWDPLRDGVLNPLPLIAGSEGTLGIVTEATVNLVPLPEERGCALLYFSHWETIGEAVSKLARLGASAAEVMDRTFLNLVKEGRPDLRHLWPEEAEGVVLVEYEGETKEEVREKLKRAEDLCLAQRAGTPPLADGIRYALEPKEQVEVWNLRKAAYPLLYRSSETRKPMNFIDDAALPLEKLADYLHGLRRVFAKFSLEAVIYGHAGNGNLHVNPMMNPYEKGFMDLLQHVGDEGFDLAISLGGTISGEHGDGIVRAPYVKKQFSDVYRIFEEIKRRFDPQNILNPGKILSEEDHLPVTQLRYQEEPEIRTRVRVKTSTTIDNPAWIKEIEKCHGCSMCRAYCPVAEEVAREEATARAKANMLTGILNGEVPLQALTARETKEVADLCYNCKRCLNQCPTGVDIPGLALEVKRLYVKTHGQTLTNVILGNSQKAFFFAALFAPLSNWLLKNPFFRLLMELATGIDRRRIFPPFSRPAKLRTARSQPVEAAPSRSDLASPPPEVSLPGASPGASEVRRDAITPLSEPAGGKVVYFPGCFAWYLDPGGEGQATIDVLEANGIHVRIPPHLSCCGVAKISLGSADEVLDDARKNVKILSSYVRKGYEVVTSAASCGLTLREEYPKLLQSEDSRLVSSHTCDVTVYLMRLHSEGKLNTKFGPLPFSIGYHSPCHAEAQGIQREPLTLLRLIPQLEVREIQDHCSGMAGTFGFKKENFDLSMRIGEHLFKEIRKTRVSYVATGCGTCNIQVRQGTGVHVLHPVKILRDAYLQGKALPDNKEAN